MFVFSLSLNMFTRYKANYTGRYDMSKLSVTLRKPVLARTIAMLTSAVIMQNAFALPQLGDATYVNGGSSYIASGTQGTLTVSQDNRVVSFSGGGINVANGETLSFNHSGGAASWSVLANDISGNASNINGLLNGNVQVFLVNQNGIVFGSGAQIDLASLVASTHAIDDADFENGDYRFTTAGAGASIEVQGLTSNLTAAQIALLSGDINVEGDIDIAAGDLNLIAGNEVIVTFDNNNLMQFDISEALQTSAGDGVVDIALNAEVSANNINIRAIVSDPKSFAINNKGVIRATGIDIATPGVIRLVGTGGKINSTGSIDASATNGSVEMSAGRIALANQLNVGAGTVSVTIGDGASDSEGRLEFFENMTPAMSSLIITGVGDVNRLYGFANYQVTGLNEGTASYDGIGSGSGWENTAAVSFTNIEYLVATSQIANTLDILDGASISTLIGGGAGDTFNIAGTVAILKGLGGFDIFNMNGGSVTNRIDGNSDGDVINGVFNPVGNAQSGSSDFITSWTRVSLVNEAEMPPVIVDPGEPIIIDPTPFILAPNPSILGINNSSNTSLGLVSDDESLNMPCGHSESRDVSEAEDCQDPELQQLISSLIHFKNDSNVITASSANRLDRVSAYVVNSNLFDKVVFSGHADSNGAQAYNLKLSERRASATAGYMEGQGVDPEIFEIHAFGESLPARLNDSDENRAYNRRVHVELKR